MTRAELIQNIKRKRSFLCVGLDTDINKIPKHLLKEEDPVFEFNKQVIEATKDFVAAYKPNLAFYEALGAEGLRSLEKTMEIIPEDIFTIADAKRGDIGNTAAKYAETFFEKFDFDSVTIAPYMGSDSVTPFLEYEDKWAIVLALTSNPSAADFQFLEVEGKPFYQKVMAEMQKTASPEQLMFVVGATRGSEIAEARKCAPDSFLLVPGVGKQGGSLKDVAEAALTKDCGLLVNSSRGIIYAGNDLNFTVQVRQKAAEIQAQMEVILTSEGII